MSHAIRFVPALAVMAVLTALTIVGRTEAPPSPAATGPRGSVAERRAAGAQASPLPSPQVRPRPVSRLPRPRPRARVFPHVAQLFADVSTPQQVSLSPAVLAANMTFAGLLTLVLAYADKLIAPLEKGLRAVARRLLKRDVLQERAGSPSPARGVLLIVGLMIGAALLQTYLNTGRGPFGPGGWFVFGTLIGSSLLLSGTVEAVRYRLARRRGYRSRIAVRPSGVAVAGVTVALSRLLDLVPGLLIGKEGGIKYETEGRAAAGWLALVALLTTATIGALAWLASYLIPQIATEDISGSRAQDFALGLFFVAVQGVIFQMVPAGGTGGESIWRWRRTVWALLALPAAFLLFHTMLNPAGTFLDATRSVNAPIYILIAGLLCALPALQHPRDLSGLSVETPRAPRSAKAAKIQE